MATQTDTLPAPYLVTATSMQFIMSIEIGAALVEGGGSAYLRVLNLRGDNGLCTFETSPDLRTSSSHGGPHLNDEWEQNASAMVVRIGTHVATLPGPDASAGVSSRDSSEPYSYIYTTAAWNDSGMPEAIAAYMADNTLAITLTLDDGTAPAAPSWDDDTGDAQEWTVAADVSLTVPAASGNPAPTYAIVGSLPDGLVFDAATRIISGSPHAAGTGSIIVRATNSEGTDDWSVAYSISPAPTLEVDIGGPSTVNENADVTLTATVGGTATGDITYAWSVESGPGSITGSGASVTYEAPTSVTRSEDVTVRVTVTRGGLTAMDDFELTVSNVVVPTVAVTIAGVERVEEGGSIPLTATVTGTATGDTTFVWIVQSGPGSITGTGPSVTYEAPDDVLVDNEVVVRVEVTRESQTARADHSIQVTTPVAPSFADPTGTAQTWVAGVAITTITVPEATGTPVPTYSVMGTLPAGLQFDANTREITGTPGAAGTGSISIAATNAEGSATWTVAYTTAATPSVSALSVAIAGQVSVGPGEATALTTVRGGTLRGTATYQWEILSSGAGTIMPGVDTSTAVYTAPSAVPTQETVTVRVTITVGSESAMDDRMITLRTAAEDTLTVTIRGNSRVVAGDDVALFVEVGGTATGTAAYTWSVGETFGSIIGSGLAVLYQSIASTSQDAIAIIAAVVSIGNIRTYARFAIEVTGVAAVVPAPVPRTGQIPYVGRIRLMGPVTLGDGTALGQARRITEATVGLFRSAGGIIRQAGQRHLGDATPLAVPGPDDQAGPQGYRVVSGEAAVPLHDLSTDPTATIQIEQNDPQDLEITYLAVSFDSED